VDRLLPSNVLSLAAVLGLVLQPLSPRAWAESNTSINPGVIVPSPSPTHSPTVPSPLPSSITITPADKEPKAQATGTEEQAKEYDTSIQTGKDANKANKIGMGIWGAVAALCGVTCVDYLMHLAADRTGVQGAMAGLTTASAALDAACAPATVASNTVVRTQLGHCQTALIRAHGATAVASAASASVAPVAGAVGAPDELATSTCGAIAASTKTASAAATAAIATYSASVYGAPYAAACSAALASFQTADAAMTQAVTKYTTTIGRIVALGTACGVAGVAGAAGDVAASAKLQQDTTKKLVGVIGAAPAVVSAVSLLFVSNGIKNAAKTASTMGTSSCWSTGISLALIGYKAYDMTQTDKSIQQNQDSKDALQSTSSLERLFREFGIANATAAPAPSACSARSSDTGTLLSCAVSGDPLLKKMFAQPGQADLLFGQVERTFGVGRATFISETPPSMERISQMIAGGDVDLASRIQDVYSSTEQQVALERGGQAPEPRLGVATRFPDAVEPPSYNEGLNGGQATGGGQAPESLPVGAGRAVASGTAITTEGIHGNARENLFEIVGARYQKAIDTVEPRPWGLPFNQYSNK
jgi:hypothetical protein